MYFMASKTSSSGEPGVKMILSGWSGGYLSPGGKKNDTAHQFGTVGIQHARNAVAEGVPRNVCRSQLQGLNHARYVTGQGVKSYSVLWAGTLPRSPEIDSHCAVASFRQSTRKRLHVTNIKAPTREQDDRCPFTLAEVLNIRVADLHDAGLHAGSDLFRSRLRGSGRI
jgi:hypothetical protein